MFRSIIVAVLTVLGLNLPILPPPIDTKLSEVNFEFATNSPIVEAPELGGTEEVATSTLAVKKSLPEHLCSCVAHSRKLSPYQPIRVKQASEIPAIQLAPKVGGWVLMNIPPFGHSAVVTKILGDKIEISESNYPIPCEENTRIISIDDKTIRGYFWHDLW